MNKNLKMILCALLAVLTLCSMAACRTGGDPTDPTVTKPAQTLPKGEAVSDWIEPDATEPEETTMHEETTELEETTEPVETTEPKEITEPEETTESEETTEPVETTEPEETTEPTQPKDEPSTQVTEPQTGSEGAVVLSYEEYMALSPAEQQAYYESFPSLGDYIAWYNAALAEYEANQDIIEATGPIDIGDYINP